MSLLYLKSSKYMNDSNGSQINISDGLPFKFNCQFKEPLDINSKSKIEVVSAILKVDNVHDISLQNDNNAFTHCIGLNGPTVGSQRFLQKQSRIPDGKYSNNQLAGKINDQYNRTNLLDGVNIKTTFNTAKAFKIEVDLEYDTTEETDNNTFGLINSKMAFNESTTIQNTGIGTGAEQITIVNQNSLTNENTLTKNSTLTVLTDASLNKPTNLISNMIVPTLHGITNCGGAVSSIMKPIKHLVFPTAFQTPTAGVTFTSVIGSATTNGITILAADSANNDFKFTAGATTYHAAFVKTKAQWDSYTLPNSITNGNLPWGHFIILNTTNVVPNTTLAANYCTLLLDTNDYKWKLWNAGSSSLTTFNLFSTTNQAFVKTTATLTSLGNWGSGCLGISRGETCIVGSNQIATGTNGRYSRTRVFNDSGDGDTDIESLVFCDYVLQLHATSQGDDSYVTMNTSEQVTGKVAGDVDWLTLNKQSLTDALKLKNLLPTITDDDNIILVASVTSWLCVKFFIGHDTAGNQVFGNLKKLGDTDSNNVGDALLLPTRFNEASFPIMPVIAPSNGYVKDEQKTLTIGQYSNKNVTTHSIAKLNAYMNTNWSSSETIPVRQPKTTLTNYCNNLTLENRVVNIESGDFSSVTSINPFTIPFGIVKAGEPIRLDSDFDILIRLSNLEPRDTEYQTLLDNNYTIEPNRLNTLYQSMGMPRILFNDRNGLPEEPPKLEFESTGQPISNGSQNFIINLEGMGRVSGNNSATKSVNKAIAIIPASSLVDDNFLATKTYTPPYQLPVKLNAVTSEKVNNFDIFITTDENKPATSLMHPTTLVCRITD